jgi:DNA-nicking Smr family endonuclease
LPHQAIAQKITYIKLLTFGIIYYFRKLFWAMGKKTDLTEADLLAFHQAMKGTRPLHHKHKKVQLKPFPSSPPPKKPAETETPRLKEPETPPSSVSADSFLFYHRSGISHHILRKLRKGQYNVEAVLDLHGFSVEKAGPAVSRFLQRCLYKGCRVVLIVHGKGQRRQSQASQPPVLKNKLNQWLRELRYILAFCTASPQHGGSGALYILLQRATEEKEYE